MKVVHISGKRKCNLIEKPMPRVKENFVLLKIHVAPMCNEYLAYRDFDFRERNKPDSLGHEAAGEIVDVGSAVNLKVGERVVALCGYPCGRCYLCRCGYYSHCKNIQDPLKICDSESGDCSFAEYMLKQDWLLLPIPEGMSYEHASMACCGLGPTFGAMQIMNVSVPSTVLITGLGPVGLGGVINGIFRGARVIGVARNSYRRSLARDLGAELVLDPGDENALQIILDATDGEGVDCAIECSSGSDYQRLALDATRRKGKVTFLAE
jgi:L-iditol 2-dehydrogenase